jgi:glutamyl-tRNA synthetase
MDGDEHGVAEPGLAAHDVDDVVQFERVGYARIDDVSPRDTESSSGDEPRDDVEFEGDADVQTYFAHP